MDMYMLNMCFGNFGKDFGLCLTYIYCINHIHQKQSANFILNLCCSSVSDTII